MGLRGPKTYTGPMFNKVQAHLEYEPNSGCWLWSGAIAGAGYGVTSRSKRMMYVHRIAWEHFNGRIPFDKLVLHKCDTPPCANPDHLFLGTNMENTHDMMRKRRAVHMKITPEDMVEIQDLLHAKIFTQLEVGRLYGIAQPTVSEILRGKRWHQRSGLA